MLITVETVIRETARVAQVRGLFALPRIGPVEGVLVAGGSDTSIRPREGQRNDSDAGRPRNPIVIDEFTSVVDRTVAQIGSAAFARTVRSKGLQAVCVTCHEDVLD